MLVRGLREEGFARRGGGHGWTAARPRGRARRPDLLVIDIGLPDADGRDLCQALRAHGVTTPVLFLTARDALTDRLVGLQRRRRRLPDQAVRASPSSSRACEALLRRAGVEPVVNAGALPLDPGRTRWPAGRRGAPHADRVPPAGAAGRDARRGRAAPRPGRGGLAPRRDRATQHPRRLPHAPAPQAVRPARRPDDRHRARRRLLPAVSP